jgi:hypothetical protein
VSVHNVGKPVNTYALWSRRPSLVRGPKPREGVEAEITGRRFPDDRVAAQSRTSAGLKRMQRSLRRMYGIPRWRQDSRTHDSLTLNISAMALTSTSDPEATDMSISFMPPTYEAERPRVEFPPGNTLTRRNCFMEPHLQRRSRPGRPGTRTNRWYALVSLLLQVAAQIAQREQVEHQKSVAKARLASRDLTGRLKRISPTPESPTSIAAGYTDYSAETLSRASREATVIGLIEERSRDTTAFLPANFVPRPTARRPHWSRRLSDAGVEALGPAPEGWKGHWPTVVDPVPSIAAEDLYSMMALLADELDGEKLAAARRH